jgi:hypothetical protein
MNRAEMVLLCSKLVESLEGDVSSEAVLERRMREAKRLHVYCIQELQHHLDRKARLVSFSDERSEISRLS